MKRNPNFSLLKGNYLFPEVQKRRDLFLKKHSNIPLINLGVGDTKLPIPTPIAHALKQFSEKLGTIDGYSGYGPEQGMNLLRQKISKIIYKDSFSADEIFISDGANSDLARLQHFFGSHVSIAIQDPTYPVYFEGSLLQGVKEIIFMPCHLGNQFFPDLNSLQRTDLIYFCSPNNPTGYAATRSQLKQLVDFALANQSIIIFDNAYSAYIQDAEIPKSIYEIENADRVAIEVNSFSKLAGFSGVRLGWTVIPKNLKYDNGLPLNPDWDRLITTLFNGASNIAQFGGIAVLENMDEIEKLLQFYLRNAALLKAALESNGIQVFGGFNSPYLWAFFPEKDSWEMFDYFLNEKRIVTIPGVGFGSQGQSFLRFSSFANQRDINEAIRLLTYSP